jgi:uncharacterized membrane protein AbrB (regulator of aidB expression)
MNETKAAGPSWLDRLLAFRRLPRVATLMFAAAVVLTFLAGLAGGLLVRLIGLPLPYMLGAFFVTMALGLYGAPIRTFGRRARLVSRCRLLHRRSLPSYSN